MRLARNWRLACAIMLGALLSAAPAEAADLVVRAADRFIVPVIVNGHLVRLRVDPEAPDYVVVNPAVARRIKLRPTLLGGVYALVGPVSLDGNSKEAALSHEGRSIRKRFAWLDQDVVQDADGLISPAALPYERVIFDLQPERPAEVTSSFAMTYSTEYGLLFPMRIGAQSVQFQFSTQKPRSMATAAAGAHIAEAYSGAWAGEAVSQLIEYGVHRPVRPLALQRPLVLERLPLRNFLVRTSDNLGNRSLPSEPSTDPREIVVTGARTRQKAVYMLTLGLDVLQSCSRMVYERLQHRMTLRCAAART
jgi:hypothetical protein